MVVFAEMQILHDAGSAAFENFLMPFEISSRTRERMDASFSGSSDAAILEMTSAPYFP